MPLAMSSLNLTFHMKKRLNCCYPEVTQMVYCSFKRKTCEFRIPMGKLKFSYLKLKTCLIHVSTGIYIEGENVFTLTLWVEKNDNLLARLNDIILLRSVLFSLEPDRNRNNNVEPKLFSLYVSCLRKKRVSQKQTEIQKLSKLH